MPVAGLIFLGFILGSLPQVFVASLDEQLVRIQWRWQKRKHAKGSSPVGFKMLLRKSLLEKPRFILPTGIYLAFGAGILIFTLALGGFWGAAASMLLGYVGTVLLGEKYLRHYYATDRELTQKRLAAKDILKHLQAFDATELLVAAARDTNPHTRLVAIESFETLVNADAFKEVLRLKDDTFHAVSLKAVSLAERLAPLMEEKPPLSVLGIAPLIGIPDLAQYSLVDAFKARTTSHSFKEVRQIFFSQYLHGQAYPHVYCRNCFAGVDRFALQDAAWLQCKVCKDAMGLICPVYKVIGQIGGVPDIQLEAGVLKINLWNAAQRSAIPAQIDVLEIIGGQEMDYDWAVNAVLGDLRNPHLPDNRPFVVSFIGDPKLDLNTMRLLQKV